MGKAEKVKVVIYIEIILFAFEVLSMIVGIIFAVAVEDYIIKSWGEIEIEEDHSEDDARVALRILFVIIFVIIGIGMLLGLVLLIVLYKGHAQGSTGKLKVWFYLITVGTVLGFLGVLSTIVRSPDTFLVMIPYIFHLIYRSVALVIVKSYINELESGPPSQFQGVHYSR